MALEAEILEAATRPKSSTNEHGMIVERDLRELIEADKHLEDEPAAGSVGRSAWAGGRWGRTILPGSQ